MEKQKKSLTVRLIQYSLWGFAGFLGLFFVVSMVSARNAAFQRAEGARAGNTAYNLKNAISAYYTEYRRYPVPESGSSDPRSQSDHDLMDILLGSDHQGEQGMLNPRRIAFYTGRQAKPMGDDRYRKGVRLEEGGRGELWDPWGNYYRVVLDLDGDGQVENVDRRLEVEHLPESILVWSAGPDGDFSTWKDNVTTW